MGNNMVLYTNILGEKYTYLLYHRHNVIENNKIVEGTFLLATNTSLDPYDYHLEQSGEDSFEKLEHSLID